MYGRGLGLAFQAHYSAEPPMEDHRQQLAALRQLNLGLIQQNARLTREKAVLDHKLATYAGVQLNGGLVQLNDVQPPAWTDVHDNPDARIELRNTVFDPSYPYPEIMRFSQLVPQYRGTVPRCHNLRETAVLLHAFATKGAVAVNAAYYNGFREDRFTESEARHAITLMSHENPDEVAELLREVAEKGWLPLNEPRWDKAIESFLKEHVKEAVIFLPYFIQGAIPFDNPRVSGANSWPEVLEALEQVENGTPVFLCIPLHEASEEERRALRDYAAANDATTLICLPPPFLCDSFTEYLERMRSAAIWLPHCGDNVAVHIHTAAFTEISNPSTCLGCAPMLENGHLSLRDLHTWSRQTRALLTYKNELRYDAIDRLLREEESVHTGDFIVDDGAVVYFPR